MARGRMISKSLSTSERYASLVTEGADLAEFCQVLYPLVVIHTDDFGRLQGDPFTVKMMCFPASPRTLADFGAALELLERVGLIAWYSVAGKRYIQIDKFDPHQQGLHKRTRSAFPRVPGISGNDAEVPGQEKGTKGKGRELKNPQPPFRGRLARRRTRQDISDSKNCGHEPRCATRHACVDRTLTDGREAS